MGKTKNARRKEMNETRSLRVLCHHQCPPARRGHYERRGRVCSVTCCFQWSKPPGTCRRCSPEVGVWSDLPFTTRATQKNIIPKGSNVSEREDYHSPVDISAVRGKSRQQTEGPGAEIPAPKADKASILQNGGYKGCFNFGFRPDVCIDLA